jgi:hypothetical protein
MTVRNFARVFEKSALLLLLCCGAALAAGEGGLSYRMASYRIARAPGADVPTEPVAWEYPVVAPEQLAAHRRLNAWLRSWALESLEPCAPAEVERLKAMPDRRVLEALSADRDFAVCELEHAVIEPREAFGPYVVFMRNTGAMGSARVHHGVEVRVFDLAAGTAVDMQTLFKPDALTVLNGALAELISADEKRPDCHGRPFDWTQVTLRPPAEVFIEFAYNPAQWRDCGDGVEMLGGRVVAEQLAHPDRLRPVRRWVKQQP